MPATAVATIVVEATAQEEKIIAAKARKLGLPISELMCLGAVAYQGGQMQEELDALACLAQEAAERAGACVEASLAFVEASNARLDALDARTRAGSA
ncbi:hypothetical protein GWL_41290 [Herbaspirillum sp. GW103]|jgi:hypothetical protein|uniref:hypothetical protein n=1 Tax=unclassified Herbaspirillum TaxID=2624150 RepID=UPI00025E2B5F|nr:MULTISPECIES: hypothetical protein [unclassified Herbaspirillum]EIJ44690.1 hypothetical protein GWL_41290 [Herbaspirillum sp. GW103]MCI1006902.1 hypothetical protein [Herbaspirillum sp. C7C8]